ncbi:hypothetical protein Sjap_016631 [Stephania japonica]|uniref:Uncharacterized protein n=1 Tax=Stephania japonica TaxID=461633 RepID=A0AAP0NTM1_9MAGN
MMSTQHICANTNFYLNKKFEFQSLLAINPVKRLFFFVFRHSKQHFIQTVLPNIKHSLSLALQRFYPFAGHLIRDRQHRSTNIKPEIFYSDGGSVSVTVSESDSNFEQLTSSHARDVNEYNPLVPVLISKPDLVSPLTTLLVTLFPNSGAEDPLVLYESPLPFFDRSVIKDPKGLEMLYLNQLPVFEQSAKSYGLAIAPTDEIRVTFVLGRPEIDKLKQWVAKKTFEKI